MVAAFVIAGSSPDTQGSDAKIAVMIGAIVVWATSAAAAGALPRWFSRFGLVVGVILLFAVFFFPAFVYWLWIVVASVLLTRGERVAAAPVPQPV
jgi:hypothetical protein